MPDRVILSLQCLNPSCRNGRYRSRLLCPDCWALVPEAIKDTLYRTYTPGQDHGRTQPRPEWVATAKQAIEAAARPADLGAGWRLQEARR